MVSCIGVVLLGMGNRTSAISEQDLLRYEELTFLTRAEILYAYKKFSSLQHDVSGPSTKTSTLCVPITTVANGINSLKVNPFNLQICSVFCTSENGKMSFVDFLDLVSVFSYKCTQAIKVYWAFKVYDVNGDGYLCQNDVRMVLQLMTGRRMSDTLISRISDKIFKSDGLDEKFLMTYNDFERCMFNSPEFFRNFSFNLS